MMTKMQMFGSIFLFASSAFACSGPGAAKAIHDAEMVGLILWGLSLFIAAINLFSRWARVLLLRQKVLVALLAIFHPGWWVSARKGDCGEMLFVTSVLATILISTTIFFMNRKVKNVAA